MIFHFSDERHAELDNFGKRSHCFSPVKKGMGNGGNWLIHAK